MHLINKLKHLWFISMKYNAAVMIISSGIHYIKDLIASVVEEDHIKTNCSQMLKSGNFLTYS